MLVICFSAQRAIAPKTIPIESKKKAPCKCWILKLLEVKVFFVLACISRTRRLPCSNNSCCWTIWFTIPASTSRSNLGEQPRRQYYVLQPRKKCFFWEELFRWVRIIFCYYLGNLIILEIKTILDSLYKIMSRFNRIYL